MLLSIGEMTVSNGFSLVAYALAERLRILLWRYR
jgi:hypothetical protein